MKLLATKNKDKIWRRKQVKVRRKYKDQLFQRIFRPRLICMNNSRRSIPTCHLEVYFTLQDCMKCMQKGVLVDILEKCRSEVFHMILTEYDEKKHLRNLRKEAMREGREEGREEINTLYERLIESNRMDDVVRVTKDKKF